MPSIAARSRRSAAALTASPVRVALRNTATKTMAAGATMAAIRSLALSTTEARPSKRPVEPGAVMRSEGGVASPQPRG